MLRGFDKVEKDIKLFLLGVDCKKKEIEENVAALKFFFNQSSPTETNILHRGGEGKLYSLKKIYNCRKLFVLPHAYKIISIKT